MGPVPSTIRHWTSITTDSHRVTAFISDPSFSFWRWKGRYAKEKGEVGPMWLSTDRKLIKHDLSQWISLVIGKTRTLQGLRVLRRRKRGSEAVGHCMTHAGMQLVLWYDFPSLFIDVWLVMAGESQESRRPCWEEHLRSVSACICDSYRLGWHTVGWTKAPLSLKVSKDIKTEFLRFQLRKQGCLLRF